MSSRYSNNSYFSPQHSPYYSKQSPQYALKSPKSKTASNAIRDSGGSSTLHKKHMGQWIKKPNFDKKTKFGEFNQEAIEAELNKYKKGVFYHDDDHKEKPKHKINGPTKETQYSQYQLTRTEKPPPPIYDDLPRAVPPNYDERIQSNGSHSDHLDENKKQSDHSPKKAAPSSSAKPRSKPAMEDTKQREDTIKATPPHTSAIKKRSHRTSRSRGIPQSMVTVSPYRVPAGPRGRGRGRGRGGGRGRDPYAMYGPPPPPNAAPPAHAYDAYYGAPVPPHYGSNADMAYYENNYGREEMYAAMPPPHAEYQYPAYNSYNQYGGGAAYDYNRGVVQNDGSWYPYPDVLAPRQPPPPPAAAGAATASPGKESYATPKPKKRKPRVKAMVDLTTPIDGGRQREKDKNTPMSPGRRVNKIQKQLEYYFSASNMNGDEFLRESMDSRGYVSIDILLAFKRMKSLAATPELVIEAAYHSTSIEIDPKHDDKLRMTKYWKQYVKRKKRGKDGKDGRKLSKDKERELALDNAELNAQTIEEIVAGIERKHEKRKKRRQQREMEMEKAKKEQKKEEREKEEAQSDGDEAAESESEESKGEEVKDDVDENAQELIKKDKAEHGNEEECGDPSHADMVEID